MLWRLLALALVRASELEDEILAKVNADYSLITGEKLPHFALQLNAWTDFNVDQGRVQTVMVLNSTDTKELSLHYFEFAYEAAGVIRLQREVGHSSPAFEPLEDIEFGLVQEALSNSTNSTISSPLWLDDPIKQQFDYAPYSQSSSVLSFKLLSQQFAYQGLVYYTATFANHSGERMHYIAYRNESGMYANVSAVTAGSMLEVVVVFAIISAVTFGGMVYYWRKFDALPCQKRKEESARVVLDSNRVKSSV